MYLVILAWLYVTLLMALAEAFSTQGTVMGAIITFLFYGVLPMSLVIYLMGTPLRRKAQRRAEDELATQQPTNPSVSEPDAGSHATGLPEDTSITAVREKP